MKLAIQGHPTRGKEVIQILESLGGNNYNCLNANAPRLYYYNGNFNHIDYIHRELINRNTYKLYTLEEFERAFPFKIGDRVISITTNLTGIITKLSENGWYYVKYDNGNFACAFGQNLKLYKEMKEERNITLTLDKAQEWYKKGGELREIALQAFTEKELNPLPRSWEEFATNYARRGYYISSDGKPLMCASSGKFSSPHVCPSKKSAEAHLALIQLEQLRNCWWNGWEPIWDCSEKWCIRLWGNELTIGTTKNISRFLTFPTKEMADEFLKCFRDLIELARDLI